MLREANIFQELRKKQELRTRKQRKEHIVDWTLNKQKYIF